jgi:hypothetical protein
MKSALTLFIISLCLNCAAQTYSLNDFMLYQIPIVHSKEWIKLNNSLKSFAVSVVDGKLHITAYQEITSKEYSIVGGKLLALDRGEWGGGLYYRPDDTSKKTIIVNGRAVGTDKLLAQSNRMIHINSDGLIKGGYFLIAPGNIAVCAHYKNSWLFTQTMFPEQRNGWLSQLTVKNDSFEFSKMIDLGAAPLALTIATDNIFVVTYNAFYSILNGKKEAELNNLFWQGLYPNSIAVIDKKNIYIGMRAGYAWIDLMTKDIRFYLYNK